MPNVRLAATGMDSCPASDEDTEDELESARRTSNATRTRLLPSTSRQLVGNSKLYCYQIFLKHSDIISSIKNAVMSCPTIFIKMYCTTEICFMQVMLLCVSLSS